MSLHTNLRKFHRLASSWLVLPILFMAMTGVSYRVGRSWFGLSKEDGDEILKMHSWAWLGSTGSVIVLTIFGAALSFLILSGLWMVFSAKAPKKPVRKSHWFLAIAFSLPLLITAVTGVAYHMGHEWFHISKETGDFLMSLHQGSWLGKTLRPFYSVILGAGILGLSTTGLGILLRRK